jgi:hypothetical protein
MATVKMMLLPHAQDLDLRALPDQNEHTVGLDLVAAGPADAPVILAPGQRAAIPTGHRLAAGHRGANPPSRRLSAASRHHGAQRTAHDRCQLPRRDPRHPHKLGRRGNPIPPVTRQLQAFPDG